MACARPAGFGFLTGYGTESCLKKSPGDVISRPLGFFLDVHWKKEGFLMRFCFYRLEGEADGRMSIAP